MNIIYWISNDIEYSKNTVNCLEQQKTQILYFFLLKLPLEPDWIKENLSQSDKPKISDDFEIIETELEIIKES